MDAVENAIRNALGRGDAQDRAYREKVYRSVFAALEKSIAAGPQVDEASAQRRREALKARITEIEQEFVPAMPAAPEPPAVAPRAASASMAPPAAEPDVAPTLDPQERRPVKSGRFGRADRDEPRVAGTEIAAGPRDPARRRRWVAPLAILFGALILAAAALWAWQAGLLTDPDDSNPTPAVGPAASSNGTAAPPSLGGDAAAQARDWITLFDPAKPSTVAAAPGARAQVMQADGETFLRIRSGKAGEPVAFDIGQGTLERLAGRTAVFDIVARSEEGKETQISVSCDFAGLGDCGRRRYAVGHNRSDYLFDVQLPSGRPAAAGTVSVVSDVEGEGRAIDVYELRVSVAP